MTKWEKALADEIEILQKEIEVRKLRIEHYTREWGDFAKSGDCANFSRCGAKCPLYHEKCDTMTAEQIKAVLHEEVA